MKNKKRIVDYTSRDFNSIKQDLENLARVHYPETYRDFSENTFGSFVLDSVAYVGDMLSYYLDYQVNESFLETALGACNILCHRCCYHNRSWTRFKIYTSA